MFNVAVLNLKDIIKYFVGITILFFIIFFGAKYMKNIKKKSDEISNNAENISIELSKKNLLPCIETTLPVISQLESNNNSIELKEKKDVLKEILKTQITSINEIEEKNEEEVAEKEEINNENVEIVEETKNDDVQLRRITSKSSYRNINSKSNTRKF